MPRTLDRLDIQTAERQEQFIRLANRSVTLREITRLWNWAGHQDDPEPYFEILLSLKPYAFRDANNPNTIRFVY